MLYRSTRGGEERYEAAEVILRGLADNGGLFVPEDIPTLSKEDFSKMVSQSYQERARKILSMYLDFSEDDLKMAVSQSYTEEKFGPNPAPLAQLNAYSDKNWMLELWHGPSSAFKDMALQLLPYLMLLSRKKLGDASKYCILTATSGDTGKAALEAFSDVPGFSIIVFYPLDGVSSIQEKQMTTQVGENVRVFGIRGNFDDAQSAVKRAFVDEKLRAELKENNINLSSANSINWGRLLPQIVYYISAYVDLLAKEALAEGETYDVVVPSGNFGNVLAAWYAKQMGCPIGNLVVASNRNRALSDFLRDGFYDRKRKLQKTTSPSMDILVSSNLERLLFEICDRNPEEVKNWMRELDSKGQYNIGRKYLNRLQRDFRSGFADDQAVRKTIIDVYDTYDYVVDPHTAVGFAVQTRLQSNAKREEDGKTIFVSTASPFKFPETVSEALFGHYKLKDKTPDEVLAILVEESGMDLPEGLAFAIKAPRLHNEVIDVQAVTDTVRNVLLQVPGEKENLTVPVGSDAE